MSMVCLLRALIPVLLYSLPSPPPSQSVIKKQYGQDATNVGDEGGFAPAIQVGACLPASWVGEWGGAWVKEGRALPAALCNTTSTCTAVTAGRDAPPAPRSRCSPERGQASIHVGPSCECMDWTG